MHKVRIIGTENDTKIKVDGLEIKNVTKYEVISSDEGLTELIIKIVTNDFKIEI